MTRTSVAATRASIGTALLGGLGAGVVAAVLNAVIFATGVVDRAVETTAGGPIPLGAVIVLSIVPNIIGGAVFGALQRWTASPLRLWRTVVTAVTLLSLVGIAQLPTAPVSMLVALAAMHVIAGTAAYAVTPTVALGRAT
jgi:hypothetical protein